MSVLVDCPNPKCNEGHVSSEPCSCPTRRCWDDEAGWSDRVDHDVMTCETLCPCCCGREEVPAEEAEDWNASHGEEIRKAS